MLVFLEMDARETERGFVAHDLVDVALEHRADGAAGAMMHAVGELEVADRKLGLADVVVQRIELRLVDAAMLRQLRVEPLERFEVLALVGVKERLSEIEVLQIGAPTTACAASDARQRETRQQVQRAMHYCHSPRSIAGLPESGPASVTPRSLGPTPLLNGEALAAAVVLAASRACR